MCVCVCHTAPRSRALLAQRKGGHVLHTNTQQRTERALARSLAYNAESKSAHQTSLKGILCHPIPASTQCTTLSYYFHTISLSGSEARAKKNIMTTVRRTHTIFDSIYIIEIEYYIVANGHEHKTTDTGMEIENEPVRILYMYLYVCMCGVRAHGNGQRIACDFMRVA